MKSPSFPCYVNNLLGSGRVASMSNAEFGAYWLLLCRAWNEDDCGLPDDDDINARLAATSQSMGALKEVWHNPHLDMYSKYLLFRAIPVNLLLWGCKNWSLRKSLLRQLEVFLHCSI